MIYESPEHKLLRLLWKFNQNKIVETDRFMTDGSLDIEKVKAILVERGIPLAKVRDAFQALVLSGYCGVKGAIRPKGIAKLQSIEAAYRADLEASPMGTLIATGFGDPDQTALDSLAVKEY